MTVSIIGLGRIGCGSAAWLARFGHTVIGVDVERQHGELAGAERSPKAEPYLERLIEQAASLGKFRRAADVRSAVLESDVSLVCVPTSSNANGSQNLRELDRVFRQIGTALAKKREYHVIVLRTTVLPGTTEGRFALLVQQHSGRRAGPDFGLCMNPVFSWNPSVFDADKNRPDIVIGELDSRSGHATEQLYSGLDSSIIRTTIQAAEMLSYVSSAFHAVKITFANEIGNLCATHGIDGQEVMEYFCRERELNISPAYLTPGFAFGGPRLTKDLRALLHRAKEQDVDCPLLSAVLPSNQRQICRALELVEKTNRSKIGILSLGAKADSSNIHENPIIHLAEMLTGKGYRVRIFAENLQLSCATKTDAAQGMSARDNIATLVSPCLEEVIQDSEVVVLASRDGAIRNLPELLSENHILIDLAGATRQFTSALARKHASP